MPHSLRQVNDARVVKRRRQEKLTSLHKRFFLVQVSCRLLRQQGWPQHLPVSIYMLPVHGCEVESGAPY